MTRETSSPSSVARRLAAALVAGGGLALGGPAAAVELGPSVRVTAASPFGGCTADQVAQQPGVVYPNTEIEPWIDANPTDPRNLVAGWQQDRWSNGGARGDAVGVSKDGGATWRILTLPKASVCTGGVYLRNSDPWVSFSPNGTAYYMVLAFDPDPPSGQFGPNAMLVHRSTDGGLTWSDPVTLRSDPAGQALNDKNSITADPTNPSFAYAVWDRIVDFTLPPAGVGAGKATAAGEGPGMDGYALTRERVKALKSQARAGAAPKATGPVFFKGPTYLARTTDGGRTWEPAKVIYDPGGNRQTIGNIVDVLPNGTVIDFFVDILQNGSLRLALLRSFDKGRTFEGRPTYVTTISDSFTGTITPDELAGVRDANILFSVAVDRRSGKIYLVWQDTRFRGVDEVAFSQSSDGGRTWSTPIRVNQTPANRENPLRQQAFIPSVEVAANGTVAVTYYDFRRDGGRGEKTDHWAVFCEANCTRRASWGGEVRLNPFPFDMLDAPVAGGHFVGDYVGLVAARNVVHPLFGLATRPDVTNLYTRRVNLGGGQLASTAP